MNLGEKWRVKAHSEECLPFSYQFWGKNAQFYQFLHDFLDQNCSNLDKMRLTDIQIPGQNCKLKLEKKFFRPP